MYSIYNIILSINFIYFYCVTEISGRSAQGHQVYLELEDSVSGL